MFDSLILAGGKSSRMNGVDKGLISFNNKVLIEYPVDLIKNYQKNIIISANRNIKFYQQYATNVITDYKNDFSGPLAGIYAGIKYLESHKNNNKYLLVLPVDTPLLNKKSIDKILDIKDYEINVAFDGKYLHPTIMLIKKDLIKNIESFLESGQKKLQDFVKQLNYNKVLINDKYLVNVNDKATLERLEKIIL